MSDRYADHRRRLAKEIGPEGLAVIPAATEVIRNGDVPHQFRQDSAFWYLTGFHEPDAVAVIAPDHDEGDYALFVSPKDPAKEVWTGIRVGKEGATDKFHADIAHEIGDLDSVLGRLMIGREVLWYAAGNDRFDERVNAIIGRDYPIVMATLFFFSMLALIGNLLSDLSLVLVDPRISFESSPGG